MGGICHISGSMDLEPISSIERKKTKDFLDQIMSANIEQIISHWLHRSMYCRSALMKGNTYKNHAHLLRRHPARLV